MTQFAIKKIALLAPLYEKTNYELDRIQQLLKNVGVESAYFHESHDIDDYAPDCVITLSAEEPKLTKFPTYGLLNRPAHEYLELPRYVRNILTYDGYLTLSDKTKEVLEDLMFGARKLNSKIIKFDFTDIPTGSITQLPDEPKLQYFETNIFNSEFSDALEILKSNLNCLRLASNTWGLFKGVNVIKQYTALKEAYQQAGVCLCLQGADDDYRLFSEEILQGLASGAVVVAPYSDILFKQFDDNIYYFPPNIGGTTLARTLSETMAHIKKTPGEAIAKTHQAYKKFVELFDFNLLFNNLLELHAYTLVAKGFIASPKEDITKLPSVSYIIRTGGTNRAFLEKALNSLVKQHYPKLQVIFVIHKKFDYLDEIISQYPQLTFKVVYAIKSIRSQAIRDGMAAVDTDLFGMLDDDDEFHPNHIRSMVNALQYHDNLDWRGAIQLVYSGSIMVNESGAYETEEEFLDLKLPYAQKKRSIEHFRFYRSLRMSNHNWFMMSNSWLAKKSIIDSELLTDPGINTCEDLYFELQFAQRTHFAFSVEITSFHHFYGENSTIVDSGKHIPDTQRIALRNAFRTFRGEFEYDNVNTLLGNRYIAKRPDYANNLAPTNSSRVYLEKRDLPICAPQYYSSYRTIQKNRGDNNNTQSADPSRNDTHRTRIGTKQPPLLKPFYILRIFLKMHPQKRKILIYKARKYYAQRGIIQTLQRIFSSDDLLLQKNRKERSQSKASFFASVKYLCLRLLTPIYKKR